jgi:hypothetical protein
MFRFSVSNGVRRTTVDATSEDTLRTVFGKSGLEVGNGTINLDGTAVTLEEMDSTLEDLGINPEITHSVMSIAKLNCAVSVVMAGGVAVVASKFDPEVLKNAAKYRPDALKLVNEDKELLYSIAPVAGNKGSVNNVGAEFGSAVNSQGKATATVPLTEGMNREKFIEKYAGILSKIRKIEEQIDAAIDDIEAEKSSIAELVTEL